MKKKFWFLLLGMGLLLFLGGCSGGENEATATPEGDVVPTPVIPEPSPTAEPTATLEPTEAPPTDTPAPTNTAEPTATPEPRLLAGDDLFTVVGDGPVVPRGPDGSWYETYTDPGGAVYHDGLFHIFHNGFNSWPGSVGIAYSNSEDGENWTLVQEEPVFAGDNLDYVGLTVLASSILVEDDGTWVMYFYIWERRTWPGPVKIGRATAPEPTGPWTADPEPILIQGSDGEWDDYAVQAPSVVKTDDGYLMFYTGYQRNQAMIGMATSPDGITWTKYDDPTTTEVPFAESDPVFMPNEAGWDNTHVLQPRIVSSPDGLVMLYSGAPSVNGSNMKLGYAISEDGIHWERVTEPIFDFTRVSGGQAIWFTEFLYHDGVYYLFFELGTGGNTEIYLATYEGSLIRGE